MEQLLKEERFNFVSMENKIFINEFTKQMNLIGYDYDGEIGGGFCWGNYMIIYSQTGITTKKVIARIYIRDKTVIIWGGKEHKFNNSIVLRLFFNKIDKHREYIEKSPKFIKDAFVNKNGVCNYCKKDCRMRKNYTMDGKQIVKCSGIVLKYNDPKIENINEYMNIIKEFYIKK